MPKQRRSTGPPTGINYWSKEFAKIRRLNQEVRRKCGSNSPEHYQRARNYVDTEAFVGKEGEQYTQVAYDAATRYLDIREGVTEAQVKELHVKTASQVALRKVLDEMVPLDAEPLHCSEVIRGINIGKVALRETS